MSFKKFVALTSLLALPVLAVQAVKKTSWGELQATPEARQKGDAKAPLLITEFSDFQCPMCAKVQPAVQQYMEAYKGKIKVIYKYYPLVKAHPNAMPAAHAAECAADQKQFWPYHDKLFETQAEWSKLPDATPRFVSLGEALALDMPRFKACLADPTRRWSIESDMREGKERRVNATPTFFIGEERLVGTHFMTEGARTIEKVLRRRS